MSGLSRPLDPAGGARGAGQGGSAPLRYRCERAEHWDRVAADARQTSFASRAYRTRLQSIYSFLIPPGQRVLEIGCGEGDLLAAVRPRVGVGVDFSRGMIERARARHPELQFLEADAHEMELAQQFDFVILSDILNDLWDVQAVLERLRQCASARTRLVINVYSRLWEYPLAVAARLKLARPLLRQNWLTVSDVSSLLSLAGFETIRSWREILLPAPVPMLAPLCNRYLARLWPLKHLAVTNMMVARPAPAGSSLRRSVSVIVPARNESGNVADILARIPPMGSSTEVIFVEGHSRDDTYAEIERQMSRHPERACRLFRQPGRGKGDAVRKGFGEASGDVLMILDADLTVAPEDLPRFYDALVTGRADFVNGVRLVYPMEREAMRFLNAVGNKFFGLAFTWLLGQEIKDTLCGTKVLWREDYRRIAANRSYFGDFDPFGDFDLLFGAAKLGLKILDLPIRYRARQYGSTNIERWKHGVLLLRMVAFAARRLAFV